MAAVRATIADPMVILAEEPTGSLRSSQGQMIMDLLKRLNDEGTTIIQVTHSEAYAAHGDRVIQLRDGWIVEEGSGVQPPGRTRPISRSRVINPM